MEGNYSIEVLEMICSHESDRNAQVTSIPSEEDAEIIPTIPAAEYEDFSAKRESFESWMTTNAATNWLLAGIMLMIFLFMIFRCD